MDPLAYPDTFQAEWKAFRVARMTALMSRLRAAIRTARPEALVTVAAAPAIDEARDRKFQDWTAWLQSGLVDAVCPMAYTPEPDRFAEQIAAARDAVGGRGIWAGIGAYRLPPAQTIANIETARRLGAIFRHGRPRACKVAAFSGQGRRTGGRALDGDGPHAVATLSYMSIGTGFAIPRSRVEPVSVRPHNIP